MKISLAKYRGYSLIEIVICIAVLSVFSVKLFQIFPALDKQRRIIKIDKLRRLLVYELSDIQLKAFYVRRYTYRMSFFEKGDGYTVTQGTNIDHNLSFKEIGLDDVAVQPPFPFIEFLPGGAPRNYSRIYIYCKTDPTIHYIIEIQPITGRIVVKND